MTGRKPYPERTRFFAHRFVRVLHKSCAAQDIGPAACYLCCIIAHTEDAGRYAGPARFWRAQLMETLGFKSPKQLCIARQKAIDAGWLVYFQAGTRAVGEYFVTIPERFLGLPDSAIEPVSDESISSAGGTNNGTNQAGLVPQLVPLETHKRNGNGSISGTESGTLPIPIPNPIPSPNNPKSARARFVPPSLDEVAAYCKERNNSIDPEAFIAHYQANGWVQSSGRPVKDWKACIITFETNQKKWSAQNGTRRTNGRNTNRAGAGTIHHDAKPIGHGF